MPPGGDVLTKTQATVAENDELIGIQSGAVVRFPTAASLKVTYTGTPQTALVLPLTMASIAVVPVAAVGGQATYTAIAGPVLTNLDYSENSLGIGDRLTSLTFDDLVGVSTNFTLSSMTALTSLAFPELVLCGSNFNPSSMVALTSLSLPKFVAAGNGFSPSNMGALTELALPELVSTGRGSFNPNGMASLTTLSIPKLVYVGTGFNPNTMASLTTVSAPELKFVGQFLQLNSMAALVTFSAPAMVTYASGILMNSSLGNLANVTLGTIGTLKTIAGSTINISNQKLTAATVNAILALLVSLDGTNGTTLWGSGKTLNVSGGTSSAPTGQGITDKATLEARGATIMTS